MTGEVLTLRTDNLSDPTLDSRVVYVVVIDPLLFSGVIRRVYVDAVNASLEIGKQSLQRLQVVAVDDQISAVGARIIQNALFGNALKYAKGHVAMVVDHLVLAHPIQRRHKATASREEMLRHKSARNQHGQMVTESADIYVAYRPELFRRSHANGVGDLPWSLFASQRGQEPPRARVDGGCLCHGRVRSGKRKHHANAHNNNRKQQQATSAPTRTIHGNWPALFVHCPIPHALMFYIAIARWTGTILSSSGSILLFSASRSNAI